MELEERRAHTRYGVELSVYVSPRNGAAGWPPYSACTRDASVGGVFVATEVNHTLGERVDLSLSIPVRGAAASRMRGGARVDLKGEVVRVEPGGMAVAFSEPYQMRHEADLEPDAACSH